jgi:tRNA-dihydrouridine synthase A
MTIINLPTIDKAPAPGIVPSRRLSVAPMMDWTE